MSKTLASAFGDLAEALENAAAAARRIEVAHSVADSKSPDGAGDGVAGKPAGSKGSKGAAAPAVAAKSAKGGKAKTPAITFDDLKAKLTELMNDKGKQVVKELLAEFGAAKLADVDEENYSEVHGKAVELMAGGEEEGGDDDDMFGGD